MTYFKAWVIPICCAYIYVVCLMRRLPFQYLCLTLLTNLWNAIIDSSKTVYSFCVLFLFFLELTRAVSLNLDVTRQNCPSQATACNKIVVCSGNPGRTDPNPFFFCRFYELRQMLETCASMTFPDFQRLMEWCQSYFANMSLKAPIGVYGYHPCLPIPPMFTWYVSNLLRLTCQCKFQCKSYLARYDHRYDFTWKEMGLKLAWRFLRPNKTSPFFRGALHKICMIWMFRCADKILLRKWLTMDIWK